MSNSPPTFGTDPDLHSGIGWNDPATLHRNSGGGLLHELSAVKRGTFGELVRHVMSLPAGERSAYCIEKPGDHRYDAGEIAQLAARPDYPG